MALPFQDEHIPTHIHLVEPPLSEHQKTRRFPTTMIQLEVDTSHTSTNDNNVSTKRTESWNYHLQNHGK